MVSSEIIEPLQKCELFNTVEEEEIKQIAVLCQIENYKAGDAVFTQGEFGTRLYLIAEGQVALVRSVNLGGRQGTITVDLLSKGRGMGWSSLLCEPCSASASAVCQKPTKIISLEGSALRAMLEEKPNMGFIVMDRLAHVLGHRLRAAYGAMDTFQ
ncbi:MAG: cyclic nucleotide-binding domain-containing protein [Chloroflexota bacterium]|nr:cyclic nucleotide-binding domain-containing protein [Chloroflexota bacterium]